MPDPSNDRQQFPYAEYEQHLREGGAPFGGRFNATIEEAVETYQGLAADLQRSQEARREKNACILHWIDRYEEWRGRAETAEAERDRLAAEVERLKGALIEVEYEVCGDSDWGLERVHLALEEAYKIVFAALKDPRDFLAPTDGEDR